MKLHGRLAALLLGIVVPALAEPDYSNPYALTSLAGLSSYGHADGKGTAARFYAPTGLAVDPTGNVYVGDSSNQLVRKITADGTVTTVAGLQGVDGIDNGTGTTARFSFPSAITVDPTGNVYVANQQNVLRKITPAGLVSTLPFLVQGANSLALDPAGNLYFTQNGWDSIRRITTAGQLEEFAGANFTSGRKDGSRASALFDEPTRLAFDTAGTLWVADGPLGYFRRIAADGTVSSPPDIPGVSETYTRGITVDSSNQLVVSASFRGFIARISAANQATVVAGRAEERTYVDGPAETARFQYPGAIAGDSRGNLFVVDDGSNVIRRISPEGNVSTFAGMPRAWSEAATDGRGEEARFSRRCLVTRAPNGDLYVADGDNCTLRRVTPDGVVTTVAGKAGESASVDGTGSAARFLELRALTTDASGNVYLSDRASLRKVTPQGVVTTLTTDAPTSLFALGLAIDATGTIFFSHANAIFRLDTTGHATVHAGRYTTDQNIRTDGSANGPREDARFNRPAGLAFDRAGNLFVADSGNNTIRRIGTDGQVTTLAGVAEPTVYDHIDGAGATARFAGPQGLAVDNAGNVYVADTYNDVVRQISPAGKVSTLVGLPKARGNGVGVGKDARLDWPMSLASTPDGTLFLANTSQIYRAQSTQGPAITAQPQNVSASEGASAQFSVTATGNAPLTYQWQLNGSSISGATAASLNLSNLRTTDAGDYSVVVTNAFGTATSSKAVLTVSAAPPPPSGGGNGGGSGGGGAPSWWFVGAVGIVAMIRRLTVCIRRSR